MKIKEIDGFKYELENNEKIIGIITDSKDSWVIIIKPKEKKKK